MRADGIVTVTGGDLLGRNRRGAAFLRGLGLHHGDRCGLLAPNSIRRVAMDVAMMAEGIMVVPLYARQAPAELAAMICDAQRRMFCCGDDALRDTLRQALPDLPLTSLLDELFAGRVSRSDGANAGCCRIPTRRPSFTPRGHPAKPRA